MSIVAIAAILVICISIGVAKFHGSFRLGQALWFIFIGLLAASLWPTLPQTANNFVTGVTTSVSQTHITH